MHDDSYRKLSLTPAKCRAKRRRSTLHALRGRTLSAALWCRITSALIGLRQEGAIEGHAAVTVRFLEKIGEKSKHKSSDLLVASWR